MTLEAEMTENTKHTFGIILSNAHILISKTRLLLVNTMALSCR